MSQLITATNSWGERQSWKSAAIHKRKKQKREGEGTEGKKRSEDEKREVVKAVNRRPDTIGPATALCTGLSFKHI